MAVDKDPQNITYSRQCLNRWASSSGFEVDSHVGYPVLLTKEDRVISVYFRVNDILEYINSERPGMYDLIMAHSLLDLLDLSQYFPFFTRILKKNGLFYFSLLFDGLTGLRPEVDPQLDERIISIYHDTMNTKKTEMGYKRSETGRYLRRDLKSEFATVGRISRYLSSFPLSQKKRNKSLTQLWKIGSLPKKPA